MGGGERRTLRTGYFEAWTYHSFSRERRPLRARHSESLFSSAADDLFTRYQQLLKPRIELLGKDEKGVQGFRKQSGPWLGWAKKWAFRGYFWWNGGVLEHVKETTWDADKVVLD
jgi:hypothetical protein